MCNILKCRFCHEIQSHFETVNFLLYWILMKSVYSALVVNLRNTESNSPFVSYSGFFTCNLDLKWHLLDSGTGMLFKNSGLLVNGHNLECHN